MRLKRTSFLALVMVSAAYAQQTAAPSPTPAAQQPSTTSSANAPTLTSLNGPHATEQQVRALFDAIHLREMLTVSQRNVLQYMTPMLQQVVGSSGAHLDAADRTYITDLVQKQADKTFGPAYLDEVVRLAVPVYQQNMTPEDVQAATAFFSSPAGQRYLTHQTDMQKAMIEKVGPVAQARADEMQKELQPQVEAYLAKKYPKGSGAGTGAAGATGGAAKSGSDATTPTPKSGTDAGTPPSAPTPKR